MRRTAGKGGDSTTSCPTWSPAGRSLAYVCRGSTSASDVNVVDVVGRRARRLTHGNYASDVAWSPDGEWIAFTELDDAIAIRPNGTARSLIARFATDLQWSPDGRRIAYFDQSRGEEPYELLVVNRGGGNKHLIARGVCCPRWSPRGNRLAFVKDDADGRAAIYVVGADGKGLVKASSPPQATDD